MNLHSSIENRARDAPAYSTASLAEGPGGGLRGPGDRRVVAVNSLDEAEPPQITFIVDRAHAGRWVDSHASAAGETADHLRIGRGATIGAKSGVTRDVPDGHIYLGYPRNRVVVHFRVHHNPKSPEHCVSGPRSVSYRL